MTTNTIQRDATHHTADADVLCSISSECRFCNLSDHNDLFGELYSRDQIINVPNLPSTMCVAMDCFPLGHRGAHLLLMPKAHYRSLSQFPDRSALIQARDATARLLQQMHPDHWLFFFEHGPGELEGQQVRCGGCHVDHAHGHMLLLPIDVEFEDIRERVETALDRLDWDLGLQKTISPEPFIDISATTGPAPYLHIGTLNRHAGISYTYHQTQASQSIPSQLLRRLIAEAAGFPQPTYWNWKIVMQHRLEERLGEFARDIRAFFDDLALQRIL